MVERLARQYPIEGKQGADAKDNVWAVFFLLDPGGWHRAA
jgi:hypothetical protein